MSKKIKLAGMILGTALSTSAVFAGNGSCGAGKCGAGKCGSSMNQETKEMKDTKAEMKDAKGACGAGKCGGNMSADTQDMKPAAKTKATGACGAGKCG